MPEQPSPAELARFDQAFALVSGRLDELIVSYQGVLAEAEAAREIDLAGLGRYLVSMADPEALAELLAVAIDRLVGPNRNAS